MTNQTQTQEVVKIKRKGDLLHMKMIYGKALDILLLLSALCVLLIELFDSIVILLPGVTILLGIVLILSIPIVGNGPKYYSIVMGTLGSFFLIQEGANFQIWQNGIPISQTVLSFVIICSWGMALTLPPFSATTLVVARDTPFSPYQVSVTGNIGFISVLFVLLVITAYSFHLLGI